MPKNETGENIIDIQKLLKARNTGRRFEKDADALEYIARLSTHAISVVTELARICQDSDTYSGAVRAQSLTALDALTKHALETAVELNS